MTMFSLVESAACNGALFLVFTLHGMLLRTIAAATGTHFVGLGAAARQLRREKRIFPNTAKKLVTLEAALGLLRHITSVSAEAFVLGVQHELGIELELCQVGEAVKQKGNSLQHVTPMQKADREIMSEAVELKGCFVDGATKQKECLPGVDREFRNGAVKQIGNSLQSATPMHKADREIMSEAVEQKGCFDDGAIK